MNELASRIRKCAEICGGIGILAQKTAIPRRTLDSYLAGSSEPKWSNLKAIGLAASVDFNWLVTGTGNTDSDIPESEDLADEYAYIPGYSIQVSAGNGRLAGNEAVTRKLAFRQKWLKYRGLSEKNLVIVFAKGDSMEPTISDNNSIMVDRSDCDPQDGRMYVIRVDGHLLVKRTQIIPGHGVKLISDNKDYEPMLVKLDGSASDIEVIGRVVWIGKDF
jgi:phage repressor protein C with HTH and peptisase S24 domain